MALGSRPPWQGPVPDDTKHPGQPQRPSRDHATRAVSKFASLGAKAEATASAGSSRHGPDLATVVSRPVIRRRLHITTRSPPATGCPAKGPNEPRCLSTTAPRRGLKKIAAPPPSNRRRTRLACGTWSRSRRLRRCVERGHAFGAHRVADSKVIVHRAALTSLPANRGAGRALRC